MDLNKKMELSLDDIIKLNKSQSQSKPRAGNSQAGAKPQGVPRAPLRLNNNNNNNNNNNSSSMTKGVRRQGLSSAGVTKRQASNSRQAQQAPKNLAAATRALPAKRAPTGVTSRIVQLRQKMANQLASRWKQQVPPQKQGMAPKLLNNAQQAGKGRGKVGQNLTMTQRMRQQRGAKAAGAQQQAPANKQQRLGNAGRGRGGLQSRAPVLLNRTMRGGVRKAAGVPVSLAKNGSAVLNRQMLALQQQQQLQLAQQQRLASKGRLGRGSQVIMGQSTRAMMAPKRISGQQQRQLQQSRQKLAPAASKQRQEQQQQRRAPIVPVLSKRQQQQMQVVPRQQTIIRGAPGLLPQEAMLQQQQRQLALQQQQLQQQQQALAMQRQRQQLAQQQQFGVGGGVALRAPLLQYVQQPYHQQVPQQYKQQRQQPPIKPEPALLRLGVPHGGMGGMALAPIQMAGGGGSRGRGKKRGGGGRRGYN